MNEAVNISGLVGLITLATILGASAIFGAALLVIEKRCEGSRAQHH